ncbi:MAG: hypothetical protein OEW00_10990 [candidate division Zixibacteria bacterium]|nr:hypothetical protein [candidate division Zixibacteria bacterium]
MMIPKSMFTALVCLLLLTAGVAAQPQVPDDNFIEGWTKSDPLLIFAGNDLYGHIDGGAELFHEFGFNELLVQRYTGDGHEIDLEVYRMTGPEAALGIYLMKCGRETPVEGIIARSSGDHYQYAIVKGNCFIQVNSFSGDEALRPVMTALARQVLKLIPDEKPADLFRHLPPDNLVPHSERLIRGPYALQPVFTFGQDDVLQLGGIVFGVLGKYTDADDSVYTQIVIPYPDSGKAKSAYRNLVNNLDPYLKVLEKTASSFIFKDYRDRFGSAEISGAVLTLRINLRQKP